jgi:hypothetical protein
VAEEELGQDEDDLVKQPRLELGQEEDDLVKQPRLELGQEEDDLVKQPTPEELLGLELCAVSFWALLTFRGWSLPTVSRRRHKEVAHGSI